MDFNWQSFDDTQKECNSQFNSMRKKIESAYQTKFDENWIVSQWLQNYQNESGSQQTKTELPIGNPLIPLKPNTYLEFISLTNRTLGSIERTIQKPTDKEITAMEILEQMEYGDKIEFDDHFNDPVLRSQVFFDENYQLYVKEPTFSFVPQILNMFLSVASKKSPWGLAFSRVMTMDLFDKQNGISLENDLEDFIQRQKISEVG